MVSNPDYLKLNGPLLIATNHPNSFLDAVILDVLFRQPLWSLARGDVFTKPFYIKLLTSVKILPVYRTSEGVENLGNNYETFEACKTIFRKQGLVLIFSEGRCVNEWRLRPLKKGTARLAISSWESGIDLKVLPVGINYSSFRRFGKNIFLNFGSLISAADINQADTDGKKNLSFNIKLQRELAPLVYEIPETDKEEQKKRLFIKQHLLKKIILSVPAIFGFLLNAPLYLPVRSFTSKRATLSEHYDAVIMALLILLYPFYLLLTCTLLFIITKNWFSFAGLLIFPFTAWAYVQMKKQLD